MVLKKSSPCFIELACSAAASWALMTFKFSVSKSAIEFLTISISAEFSIITLIMSTSPTESKSLWAVLNSNKANEAPPGVPTFANSAIPTMVNVAGVAPARTVTFSPTLKSWFSAVTASITTSFVLVGGFPSSNFHCGAYGEVSHAPPNVGANPLLINTVSPSTTFINCANPKTSPQASLTPSIC